jgi:hypothetical protein
MTSALEWVKSSYSGNDGPQCVEVAIAPATPAVHVRDSKNRDGAHLTFTATTWNQFLALTTEH